MRREFCAWARPIRLSKEDWQQTFAVNVGGAFNLFQQTMNQFRRQRGGAIVTVASGAAHAAYWYECLWRIESGAEKPGVERRAGTGG